MGACQDTWRRKKTRHQKQNNTKNPRLRGGEEQTELWTKVTPHLEDILQPAPRGKETQFSVSLLRSRNTAPTSPTPTHWPLVFFFSVFFFFFFLFNTQTLHFQSLKKFYLKKKQKTKTDEASPRPRLSPWWPALPRPRRQSPARHHRGATVPQLVHPGPLYPRLGGP